jgi:hypothetical protein
LYLRSAAAKHAFCDRSEFGTVLEQALNPIPVPSDFLNREFLLYARRQLANGRGGVRRDGQHLDLVGAPEVFQIRIERLLRYAKHEAMFIKEVATLL